MGPVIMGKQNRAHEAEPAGEAEWSEGVGVRGPSDGFGRLSGAELSRVGRLEVKLSWGCAEGYVLRLCCLNDYGSTSL